MSMIDRIHSPQDIKGLCPQELTALAEEIRQALVVRIGATGGHMGSNLGMIEATVALHYVFDSPRDKLVWDVSHQTYTHKILTGRKDAYLDPAHYADVSGYTNPDESAHDPFMVGHTSTAISLALGLAKGRDLLGGKECVVAVVGDGALSGGEALEGLNNAGAYDGQLLILLNDNEMSIAPNHGGLYCSLAALRQSGGKAPNNLFTAFGLEYLYVEQGNDISALVEALSRAKEYTRPVVVHIHTQKGLGCAWAEQNKEQGHWANPGGAARFEGENNPTFTADLLLSWAKKDTTLLAVNAATPGAVGWTPEWRRQMGAQYQDVAIAEEHAVALVSGAAKRGAHAVLAIQSSFAQRTYDQLLQDLALNRSPATVLVYFGGFSPADPTHAGCYDIAMMSNIPGLLCLAPHTQEEYGALLRWSLQQTEGPVVIRVPQQVVHGPTSSAETLLAQGVVQPSTDSEVAIVGLGDAFTYAQQAAIAWQAEGRPAPTLVNPVVYSAVSPALVELLSAHRTVVCLETGIIEGGYGAKLAVALAEKGVRTLVRGADKRFIDREAISNQLARYRMTPEAVVADLLALE